MENFFSKLFNFSFREFVAPQLVSIIYFLTIVVTVILAIITTVSGFAQGILSGLGALSVSIIIAVLYLLVIRVILESLLAVIRTSENTDELLKIMRKENETQKENESQ